MPQVTSIELRPIFQRGNAVVVHFDDRHMLSFYPNYNQAGEAHTFEEFRLVSPTQQVVANFYSPTQNPVNCKRRNSGEDDPEFGFDWLLVRYELPLLLEYLLSAWSHLRDGRPHDPFSGIDVWTLLYGSEGLVAEIRAGVYPVPEL